MHDIKLIRENPNFFDNGMKLRGLDITSAQVLAMDETLRSKITELQLLQSRRNEISKQIPTIKKDGGDVSALVKEAEGLKVSMPQLEKDVEELQKALNGLLCSLPNIPGEDLPIGPDDDHNLEMRVWGEIPTFDFEPLEHADLGEKLGLMDFEQTAKIAGARFTTLKGGLARLERALASFMLDIHTLEFGFTEVVPPHLVKQEAVFGVGQLPKFEEDLFKTTDGRYLISTAEVSLTNLVADKIVGEEELPMRFTAYTPCYRSEAGSAGRDTRGMIRQHQFSKVEMVCITSEKDSEAEHERMTKAAETILQRLGLPYRVVKLCTGSVGFSSRRTYDLEVWLPGQKKYREISSCSNCYDFQARRMKARYKELHGTKNSFVHTLNGSGLAIGRTIIAIIENYQNADGSITIPPALVRYMGGIDRIES